MKEFIRNFKDKEKKYSNIFYNKKEESFKVINNPLNNIVFTNLIDEIFYNMFKNFIFKMCLKINETNLLLL